MSAHVPPGQDWNSPEFDPPCSNQYGVGKLTRWNRNDVMARLRAILVNSDELMNPMMSTAEASPQMNASFSKSYLVLLLFCCPRSASGFPMSVVTSWVCDIQCSREQTGTNLERKKVSAEWVSCTCF